MMRFLSDTPGKQVKTERAVAARAYSDVHRILQFINGSILHFMDLGIFFVFCISLRMTVGG